MMLVKILEFSSNWWVRFGRNPHDRYRYTTARSLLRFHRRAVRKQDEAALASSWLDPV
jgi:hypothetical protein